MGLQCRRRLQAGHSQRQFSGAKLKWLLFVLGLSIQILQVSCSTAPFSFQTPFSRRRNRNKKRESTSPQTDDTNKIPSINQAAESAYEPDSSAPRLVSEPEKLAFEQDGFIVIRGLFSEEEVDAMTAAADAVVELAQQSQKLPLTFSVLQKNLIYGGGLPMLGKGPSVDERQARISELRQQILQTYRNVALRSKLPQICAELMNLNPETQCLRLLRDVFLAKEVSDDPTCDWHVDDQSFWPESFLTGNTDDSGKADDAHGINVWVALDEYTDENGGAMILSRGSHKAEWRHEAYEGIGQDRTTDGGMDKEEMYQRIIGGILNKKQSKGVGTCALNTQNPDVRAKAEAGRVELTLNKGDCILATRLLFHRTARVTSKGLKHYHSQGKEHLRRYSIRYVPGSARLPNGYAHTAWADASVLCHPKHAGKSLDEISRRGAAWYPQTWPVVDANIDAKLDQLASRECPRVLRKTEAHHDEFMQLIVRLQREQQKDQHQQ